jgi:hypothetical protein
MERSAQDVVVVIEDEVLFFLLGREPSTVMLQHRDAVF